MPSVSFNGKTIAEGTAHAMVEGNLYWKPEQVDQQCLSDSSTTTVCGWKGAALQHLPDMS